MNTQTIITAAITSANPTINAEQLAALVSSTLAELGNNTADSAAQPKREIKPVAKAIDVLTSAQKAEKGLLSAALRPSRGRDNHNAEKWVINFTFNTWDLALGFARVWGERIGLSFNVQRQTRDTFSVSIPVIGAPARKTTVAVNFSRTPDAAKDFAFALKGLKI